jgi:hypothetical protein
MKSLKQIEGAQERMAEEAKTLLKLHDKATLSTKIPRSLVPSPDKLPASLRY